MYINIFCDRKVLSCHEINMKHVKSKAINKYTSTFTLYNNKLRRICWCHQRIMNCKVIVKTNHRSQVFTNYLGNSFKYHILLRLIKCFNSHYRDQGVEELVDYSTSPWRIRQATLGDTRPISLLDVM